MKKIISLGAGVQSSTLFLLSCKGILPKANLAIFADTQWEPPEVYEHLERLKKEGEKAGIPIITVTAGNLREDFLSNLSTTKKNFAAIPTYMEDRSGKVSIGRRQCTREYKIAPIETYIRREILGLKPKQHAPKEAVIEMWIGISMDEIQRMKDPFNKWQVNVYPFCGWPTQKRYLENTWTRAACKRWLAENFSEFVVPRSACIGCPFHNDSEWRELKQDKESWKDAVSFDKAIRTRLGENYKAFLHRKCRPLDEINFDEVDDGQLDMWDNECDGMCGI